MIYWKECSKDQNYQPEQYNRGRTQQYRSSIYSVLQVTSSRYKIEIITSCFSFAYFVFMVL
jgi:hypothetical protein